MHSQAVVVRLWSSWLLSEPGFCGVLLASGKSLFLEVGQFASQLEMICPRGLLFLE